MAVTSKFTRSPFAWKAYIARDKVQPSSAAAMLAGVCGFAACLAYIAFFVFYQRYLQSQGPLFMVVVLGVGLLARSVRS